MKTRKEFGRYRTVEALDKRVLDVRLLILGRIEKGDWSGARRHSMELYELGKRRVQIQKKLVKALPLFSKKAESPAL